MRGYGVVSMADPVGGEWCNLEAAPRHVSTVASLSRANSKCAGSLHYRIMEAGAAVTSEWTKFGQSQPGISLTAIIDVASQRHAIWPLLSECAKYTARTNKGWQQPQKGGRGNRRNDNRWGGKGSRVIFIRR